MLWNLLLGLIFIGAVRYGDYITYECPQGSYTCPKYCDVDHKHFPREECEKRKSKKSKGDIMPDPKSCIAAGLKPGTEEYEKCVAYKGKYAKKSKKVKKDKNIVPAQRY